jgi:uncharacterized protein YjbI with pentapeptide repeats
MNITPDELKRILYRHAKWLDGKGGERANLSGANLSWADLSEANLSGVLAMREQEETK